jgi:hypothetical protein
VRQANDTQNKITLSPRARAQVEKSFIERTIAEAWAEVEGHLPCYEARAEYAVGSLEEAGFEIVRKPLAADLGIVSSNYVKAIALTRGPIPSVAAVAEALGDASPVGPEGNVWSLLDERYRTIQAGKPIPTGQAEDRIAFARRFGNWDGVTLQDIQKWLAACRAGFMSRDDAIRWMGGDPVDVDRKIAEERARAASFGLSYPSAAPSDTAAPEPERDYSGLRENSADDLAARYGCRVTLAGMDDADTPLTDEPEIGDTHYVVVTERATGRHVALVEAWETEDGDPLVPKNWLEVVLSAWDAAKEPQQAA